MGFFCFLLLLFLIFMVFRSGRFGPPPWGYRGHYRHYGPGPQPGPPGEGEASKGQWNRGQQWMGPWGPPPRPEDEALKLLADRLANGDITPDEYLQRVSVLRQQQP